MNRTHTREKTPNQRQTFAGIFFGSCRQVTTAMAETVTSQTSFLPRTTAIWWLDSGHCACVSLSQPLQQLIVISENFCADTDAVTWVFETVHNSDVFHDAAKFPGSPQALPSVLQAVTSETNFYLFEEWGNFILPRGGPERRHTTAYDCARTLTCTVCCSVQARGQILSLFLGAKYIFRGARFSSLFYV